MVQRFAPAWVSTLWNIRFSSSNLNPRQIVNLPLQFSPRFVFSRTKRRNFAYDSSFLPLIAVIYVKVVVKLELRKLRGDVKRDGNKGIHPVCWTWVNGERVAQWTHILPPAKLDLHRQTLRPPVYRRYMPRAYVPQCNELYQWNQKQRCTEYLKRKLSEAMCQHAFVP